MEKAFQKRWALHFTFAALLTVVAIVAGVARAQPARHEQAPPGIARL